MKLDAQCVISLRDQMRINAQQSTIDWIRSLVDEQVIYPFRKDDKYDFRVFDSPQENVRCHQRERPTSREWYLTNVGNL